MATSKFLISKSLWFQLGVIATIVTSTILGFKFVVSELKSVVQTEMAALIKKVEEHDQKITNLENLLAANTSRVDAVFLSTNIFIDSYNRSHNREFLRPSDITSESIVTIKGKKRK